MKKFICVFMVLLLCGCTGKASEVKAVTKGLSAKAHIYHYGKEYECDIKCQENGEVSFLITSPKNLKDFTIIFKDGEVTASYRGLKYTPALDNLPSGAVLSEIYGVIEYLQKDEYTVNQKSETFFVKGETGGNDFCFYLTEAGLPLNIVFEKNKFYVVFSEVTL